MGEADYTAMLLERAFLIQQKRVWSLETLQKFERRQILGRAPDEQRDKLRSFLEGNLRTAKTVLDEIAKELGYSASMRKMLDPTFVLGAPSDDVTGSMLERLDRVDTLQREAGTHHSAAMVRELLVTHEPFLEDVQQQVREDVELQALLGGLEGLTSSSSPSQP
jgi:hypothetical protein